MVWVYKVLLCICHHKVLGCKDNFLVSYDIGTGEYVFWYMKPSGGILEIERDTNRDTALFKYSILL